MDNRLTELEEMALLERIVTEEIKVREMQERIEEMKNYFRDDSRFVGPQKIENDRFTVSVTETRRVSGTLAKQKLDSDMYNNLLSPAFDSKKAKLVLTEEEYASIQTVGKPTVKITVN